MNVKPIGDRVIVKSDAPETKTIAGLYIPDQAKERPQSGTAIAIGNGVRKVKPQDRLLYGKAAGTEIIIDGQECLMMRESDIYAII